MLLHTHFKPLTHLSRNLTLHLRNPYVKQSQIDQISKKYDPSASNFQKLLMYGAIFKHIGFEGLKGLRADMKVYKDLKNRQQILTLQQTKTLMRINHDILKLGPLFIIQALPFSGPLFMLYMYTYPGSIPSWFMIDYYHDRHQQLKMQNQSRALKHFQELGLKPEDIKLDEMTLRDLRKTCLLLFGIYRDGTVGYRKLFNKKIQHFIVEEYSRYLIKRYMQKKFKRDLLLRKYTDKMTSLQEMVRWKYQKTMKGEFRFEYKPMYEKTLEKMRTNQGEESVMFREIEQEALGGNTTTSNANKSQVKNNVEDKGSNASETKSNNQINNKNGQEKK